MESECNRLLLSPVQIMYLPWDRIVFKNNKKCRSQTKTVGLMGYLEWMEASKWLMATSRSISCRTQSSAKLRSSLARTSTSKREWTPQANLETITTWWWEASTIHKSVLSTVRVQAEAKDLHHPDWVLYPKRSTAWMAKVILPINLAS